MAIFFLDSSAVSKAYIIEQGSQWIKSVLDPSAGHELHVSVLAGVEVISAIIRRRRMKVGENLLQGAWELRGALARHTSFSDIMLADEDVVGLKY